MIGVLVFDEKGLEVVPDAVVHLLVMRTDVGEVVALFHRLLRPFHILPSCHVSSRAKRQVNRQSKAPKTIQSVGYQYLAIFSLLTYIQSTVSVRMSPTFSDSSYQALLFSSEIFPSKWSKSFEETSEVVSCPEKTLTITMTVQIVQIATKAKMMYMNVFIARYLMNYNVDFRRQRYNGQVQEW